ncbi:hypothetical protein ISN44_As11g004020 [Arabidopsis suecica]|uniref:Uncharacterized protein n=1 Tax=Arabidopsis suecica TaxID=45249 RepID=A0A8T1Z718_ARASU|nr:hypothetical protein ISN44_As11g004020 [Arabidopsis suecica]
MATRAKTYMNKSVQRRQVTGENKSQSSWTKSIRSQPLSYTDSEQSHSSTVRLVTITQQEEQSLKTLSAFLDL